MSVIFGLAASLRLIHYSLSLSQIGDYGLMEAVPDSTMYLNMARDLVDGTSKWENGFFIFGPGYAFSLAIFLTLFGNTPTPIILAQIFLSCVSCVLIYRLAAFLTRQQAFALIAGLLAATSYTSISLSCTILSDSLFLFLMLASLVLFVSGLEKGHWGYFVFTGVLTGIAILIRSIGQFWPLAYPVLAIGYRYLPRSGQQFDRRYPRHMWLKVGLTFMTSIGIFSPWIVRNNSVHGVATLTNASAGGPANVAALAVHRIDGRPLGEIRRAWLDRYQEFHNLDQLTVEDVFNSNRQESTRVFRTHTWMMIRAYFDLVWENLTATNVYHRFLTPHFAPWLDPLDGAYRKLGLHKLCFLLSMAGLFLLLRKGHWWPATVLGSVYFYYALLIGFTRWQGSRLFLPGQIAWTILAAVSLVTIWNSIERRFQVSDRLAARLRGSQKA